jgi:hypothetical protein
VPPIGNGQIPSGKLTYLLKITIFNGQIHNKWSFSITMLVYQRVSLSKKSLFKPSASGFPGVAILLLPNIQFGFGLTSARQVGTLMDIHGISYLVGGLNLSEKYESHLGLLCPINIYIYGKINKCSKPPTSINDIYGILMIY